MLWPDSLLQAIQTYIRCQLGPAFLDSPAASLQQVYADSSCKYPVVFILSQGMDPTTSLARLAASQGRAIGKGLHLISLGQGQGPVAESVVRVAMKTGDWVCLQVSYKLRHRRAGGHVPALGCCLVAWLQHTCQVPP